MDPDNVLAEEGEGLDYPAVTLSPEMCKLPHLLHGNLAVLGMHRVIPTFILPSAKIDI